MTVLTGAVPDQASLLDLQCKVGDLNLAVLSVNRVDEEVAKVSIDTTSSDGERTTGVEAGVRLWMINGVVGVASAALFLFLPAWTLNWPAAWGVVAVYALWQVAVGVALIPRCPELLVERVAGRKKPGKDWDMAILSVFGLLTVAKYLLAGFDHRLGWTAGLGVGIPAVVQAAALILAALGCGLVTWAMVSNAFFSKVARIQDDRGQQVATGGPYRAVRHPGYLGQVVFEVAVPVALGSLWVVPLGLISAVLLVVRTALEDRMLREELAGYEAYAGQVRYRLLPGVW